MAFWYHVPVPAIDQPQPPTIRIVEWLLNEGAEVHRGTPIAIVEIPMGRFAIKTNGEGMLRKKLFPAGTEMDSSMPIAVIAADGENIPYSRPYSVVERIG